MRRHINIKKTDLYPLTVFVLFICFLLLLPNKTNASLISKSITNTLTSNLAGWWTMDGVDVVNGALQDKSGNNNKGNFIGIATSTFYIKGKIGQGFNFDGSNDQVSIADTNNSLDAASVVTVSAWVYPRNLTSGSGWHAIAGKGLNYYLGYSGNTFVMTFSNGGWKNHYTGAFSANKWYHVVGVIDSVNDRVKIYVNGVLKTNEQELTDMVVNNTATTLGQNQSQYTKGIVDDIRIYTRELSLTEIRQLYNMGAETKMSTTPKYALSGENSGLVGWWTFDGADLKNNVTDKSGLGNNGFLTSFGATSTAVVAGKLGQGLRFDGVNDDISIPDNNSLDISTAGTVCFWYKQSSPGKNMAVMKWLNTGSQQSYGLQHFTDNKIYWNISGTGSDDTYFTSTGAYADTNWNHLCGVYSASSIESAYINGTSMAGAVTGVIPASAYNSTTAVKTTYNGSNFNTGLLDDVRIYNRALSATEIRQLYNMGVATKQAVSPKVGPTACTTGLSCGLVGYWTLDGKDTNWATGIVSDKSGLGNNGSLINMSTSTSPAQGKIGQGLRFDGNGQYVDVGNSSNLQVNTGTISAWIKTANAGSSFRGIVIKQLSYSMFFGGNICADNVLGLYDWGGSVNVCSTSGSLADNKWHYVVETFQSGVTNGTSFYVDGVAKGTGTMTVSTQTGGGTACTGGADTVLLVGTNSGACATQAFNGSIDEVRIYNRVLSVTEIRQLYNIGK